MVGHQEAEATDRSAGDEPGRSAPGGHLGGDRRHGVAIRAEYEHEIPGGHAERPGDQRESKDSEFGGETGGEVTLSPRSRHRHRSTPLRPAEFSHRRRLDCQNLGE